MTEIIDLKGEHGMIFTNHIMKTKEDNLFTVRFARSTWAFFFNDFREKAVKNIEDGRKKASKVYKKQAGNVPIYNVFRIPYRENNKIGVALPRITKDERKQKYLFIPKTTIKNQRIKISRPYYIFDVEDDYTIKHMARLMFIQW